MGAGVAIVAMGAVACGHKGPPLPPLRPVPAAASAFSIERAGPRVTLTFTVPASNLDGTNPPAVEQVAVFALSRPADAPPPTPAELTLPANLVSSVHVRPVAPDDPRPKGGATTSETRPAPGDVATFVDVVTGAAEPSSLVRYYTVVPTAGRRRGPSSPMLRVPLSQALAAPAGLKTDYTERTLTVTWQSAKTHSQYVVDETDQTGARVKRLTGSPLDAVSFDVPVQFGQARCFVVREVDTRDAVAIIGEPSGPVCVTPTDHFPPPAPAGLQAVPVEGAVELVWTASTASDLAGYVIVRSDAGSDVGQRLTPQPVVATTFRDQTARPGSTYRYVVMAVDTAKPPNTSGPSNSQTAIARTPVRIAGTER